MTIGRKRSTLKVGQRVTFRMGGRVVSATVVEDLGHIGVKGRRILRVEVPIDAAYHAVFDVPAEELQAACDAVKGKRRKPMETQLIIGGDRNPILVSRRWEEDDADLFRYFHCAHYDACLDDAAAVCKTGETFICPTNCPGKKTYKEFPTTVRLSKELLKAN
jgi:hypothetical protein